MDSSKLQFDNRLRLLGRKHAKMANGYSTHMRADGLIEIKPRRSSKRGFPLMGLTLLVLGFLGFKALILASVGPDGYQERVAKLQNGTIIEKAGGWVMQVDPVTKLIAQNLGAVMR